MTSFFALVLAIQSPNEPELRSAFEKSMTSPDPVARVAAVRRLAGCHEEETITALARALKDSEKDVRKAAAETLASCKDEGGAATQALAATLNSKEEKVDIRLAAAKALEKCLYRGAALEAFIKCICSITNFDRDLHQFGADVVDYLNRYSREDFGKSKQTPMLWEWWWEDYKEKYKKEDQERRNAYQAWKERKALRKP